MRSSTRPPALLAAAVFLGLSGPAQGGDLAAFRDFAAAACETRLDPPTAAGTADWAFAGSDDEGSIETRFRRTARYTGRNGDTATLTLTALRGLTRRIQAEKFQDGLPRFRIDLSSDCAVLRGRELSRKGEDLWLIDLGPDLTPLGPPEPLNPPMPDGKDPGGVTVAHIDSGVNYLLESISSRLARDENGGALGQDFWDGDARPFDADTGRSPFFPIRHGTAVAHILLAETSAVRLIPYRYPRPDMSRMRAVVEDAAAKGARIAMMPLGSVRAEMWDAFADAARNHPDMLFIVSAGNDGRDIDTDPLFPASLDLPNMIVVTSADPFGRLAQGSNWGAANVDLMVPGEKLSTVDHRGATVTASGSSYAVPRVAALAARLLHNNPDWSASMLIQAIEDRATRPLERGAPKVRWGWIPNPSDDGG